MEMEQYVRNFTIGADIEVFLRNRYSKQIVSAEGLIRGTKHQPYHFMEGNEFYATSLDNVMAEFCIPPVKHPKEFRENVQTAIAYIESVIPKELETYAFPAVEVPYEYLNTDNAQLFGCEPDFNIWTELANESPYAAGNLRSAGGHIHIGYENPQGYINSMLIKSMDLHVGVPMVLIEPANKRKELYGKAGAHRTKKYGVEYRTVSNFYLDSAELTEWVAQQTIEAVNFVNSGEAVRMDMDDKETIQRAINNADADAAQYLIDRFELKMPA